MFEGERTLVVSHARVLLLLNSRKFLRGAAGGAHGGRTILQDCCILRIECWRLRREDKELFTDGVRGVSAFRCDP